MATFNNGESGLSVRNKLNTIINKVEGVSTIDNDINVDGVNLSPIASTIADTAVDIFVYDTRKDSDGGAWRKRTQHTSWYNETLNTSTRGSRKEFPAVAVIVVETNQVTIYDGDDPDLPMWMVFNARNYLLYPDNISSVVMRNGLLASGGNNATYYGFVEIDFISEQTTLRTASTSYGSTVPISGRNTTFPYATLGSTGTIVNVLVNDVAMTVLPNAPIDAATGLPVPTIAVGTDGGVSVIKDDGTVVSDSTIDGITPYVGSVAFWNNETLAVQYGYASTDDFTRIRTFSYPAMTEQYQYRASQDYSGFMGAASNWTESLTNKAAIGSEYGLIALHRADDPSEVTAANQMIAQVASDYNTGWMNGDIKLATLSDKYNASEPNVTGSELVTNGTFASDVSSWTDDSDGGGAISWNASEYMDVVYTTGTARALQNVTLVTGKTYTCSVEVISETGNGYIYLGTAGTAGYYEAHQITSTGVKAFTFVAASNTLALRISNFAPGTVTVDNISVRLAEEDRSVNGNGLQVFGTVTKSAVATGADLVAYSGFGTSNYLEQPYNSDLDFGTGDCCGMAWFKHEATALTRTIFDRDSATTDKAISFEIAATNSYLQISLDDGTDRVYVNSGIAVDDDVWHLGVWVRRNNTLELYVDGVLKNTGNASSVDSISSTDARLRIGDYRRSGLSLPFGGDLALLRISATAPSPEQIKKIYEDEKVLFQDGAQATLYGSSDAVTALAYDDSNGILSVGTSAGRSDFQGLRRVNNTTNAVGAAISASNGLIVEE
jgi:hypothetical protein